jgi:ankyrin repeat protein
MRTIKILTVLFLAAITRMAFAQEIPSAMKAALKTDDPVKLSTLISKDNINNCYTEGDWQYSLLAQTIRANAKKCFELLILQGADVNKACEGYVPPLMHAAKYGRLEMVKVLVAKGANIHYQYDGDYEPANGETPLTYA